MYAITAILSVISLLAVIVAYNLDNYVKFQLWCLVRAIYITIHTLVVSGVHIGVVALASMQIIQQMK